MGKTIQDRIDELMDRLTSSYTQRHEVQDIKDRIEFLKRQQLEED